MTRPPIFALAALVAALLQPLPANAAEQAGVAAAVRGKVQIAERTGAVGRQVSSGQPVFLGNAISSGPDSGLQIILLDETTFTIGPNSEIVVDEFVYDPSRSAGKVTATVSKGVFRFVTGKIARDEPANMQVKLPTGSIGIRGTIALGQVQSPTQQVVILIGPGGDTETNKKGGLYLNAGGSQQTVTRHGWGSALGGTGQWGSPMRFDQAQIDALLAVLGVLPRLQQLGTQFGPSGNATQHSGESNFDPSRRAALTAYLTDLMVFAQSKQNEESTFDRDRRGLVSVLQPVETPTVIADGQSTFEQLRTVNTGQFFWTQANVPLVGAGNTYTMFLNVDFGARQLGGGTSRVNINPGGILGGTVVPLPVASYASGAFTGPASYTAVNSFNDAGCSGTCGFEFNGRPFNRNGVIANDLAHSVRVSNIGGGGTNAAVTGSGTALGRSPGLAPP